MRQREIFSEAEIVVGLSGAALANIVWMAPNSSVYILSSVAEKYHFYSDLAQMMNVNFANVLFNPESEIKISDQILGKLKSLLLTERS